MISSSSDPTHSGVRRKKALLIGIKYDQRVKSNGSLDPLPGSIDDVQNVQRILLSRHGYREEDIVVMTDENAHTSKFYPTREKILKNLNEFVDGAQFGDKFVFHYAGHTNQYISTGDALSEEEGLDECIIPVDHEPISNNELHAILVGRLPESASLTAIIDSSSTGTMLDLGRCRKGSETPWTKIDDEPLPSGPHRAGASGTSDRSVGFIKTFADSFNRTVKLVRRDIHKLGHFVRGMRPNSKRMHRFSEGIRARPLGYDGSAFDVFDRHVLPWIGRADALREGPVITPSLSPPPARKVVSEGERLTRLSRRRYVGFVATHRQQDGSSSTCFVEGYLRAVAFHLIVFEFLVYLINELAIDTDLESADIAWVRGVEMSAYRFAALSLFVLRHSNIRATCDYVTVYDALSFSIPMSTQDSTKARAHAGGRAPRTKMFVGGVAAMGALLGGFYYFLNRQQNQRLSRVSGQPAAVPSWENRIHRANDSPITSGDPEGTTTPQAANVGRSSVPATPREPERTQHVTRQARREQDGDAVPRDKSGAPLHPVPQRDRGDGAAYTKKARDVPSTDLSSRTLTCICICAVSRHLDSGR
ncbi:hypothetical protein EVG20_g5154 [Dentipellis fragilis]|uniref:Peptidase C14 caspase domain-containing protein n=1 Tax=Dentipellis fragilis TaxID=205917 RepID=A0A4Y9YW09_9AGAM|nr:hypothetical protein EVG20_g5154 [Dentipellis fragilis]